MNGLAPPPLRTPDGVELFRRSWPTEGPPRACVVLVHGYAEHSGRYEDVTRILNRHGLHVESYDQRGHGRTGGARAYIPNIERVVDDLEAVTRVVRASHPEAPLFHYGHSVGGLVVLLAHLRKAADVRGLVLSSPALMVRSTVSPLLRRLAPLVARIAPRLPTTAIDPEGISHDPSVVRAYREDPLVYTGGTPARTGLEILRAGARVRERLDRVTAPMLVFHGGADPLIDPEGSRILVREAASADKTLRIYDGLYHETHNEASGPEIVTRAAEWILARV